MNRHPNQLDAASLPSSVPLFCPALLLSFQPTFYLLLSSQFRWNFLLINIPISSGRFPVFGKKVQSGVIMWDNTTNLARQVFTLCLIMKNVRISMTSSKTELFMLEEYIICFVVLYDADLSRLWDTDGSAAVQAGWANIQETWVFYTACGKTQIRLWLEVKMWFVWFQSIPWTFFYIRNNLGNSLLLCSLMLQE